MKFTVIVTETNRDHIADLVRNQADVGDVLKVSPPKRTNDQNALMWSLLAVISRQVDWYGQKLSDYDWKDVFSASLKKAKVVPGLETGSFVVCGQSTSNMNKSDFSEMIELIYAFGAEKGVKWPQPLIKT